VGEEMAEHGTQAGYTSDGCRCPVCRDAWAAWYRNYRQERKTKHDERILHGKFIPYGMNVCMFKYEPGVRDHYTHSCGKEPGHDGWHSCPLCRAEWDRPRGEVRTTAEARLRT